MKRTGVLLLEKSGTLHACRMGSGYILCSLASLSQRIVPGISHQAVKNVVNSGRMEFELENSMYVLYCVCCLTHGTMHDLSSMLGPPF